MIQLRKTLLACLVGISTAALASDDWGYDINATGVTYKARGGCEIAFILDNKFPETLEVRGEVFISVNDVTLGDASLSLPPAVPNGRSLGKAVFYEWDMANRKCPGRFDFAVTTETCKFTGRGEYLRDRYCIFTKSFSWRPG